MVFLGIWFLLQFLSAAATPAQGGGVAWWAHIGGFLFGILVAWYFSGRRAESRSAAPRAARPQIVTVRGRSGSPHLFGDLHITPQQSRSGTSKPVTIPWGFHTRRLNIRVPPGIRDGAMLRLAGMGRFVSGGQSGDLFLKVHIT
jgi:hypothetical protein